MLINMNEFETFLGMKVSDRRNNKDYILDEAFIDIDKDLRPRLKITHNNQESIIVGIDTRSFSLVPDENFSSAEIYDLNQYFHNYINDRIVIYSIAVSDYVNKLQSQK